MGRGEFLELDDKTKPDGPGEPDQALRDHVFYLERATRALYAGAPEAALKYYSRALDQNRQLEDAWTGQLLALIDLAEYDEAEVWARRALEHCPGSAACFALRAIALSRQGLTDKAAGFVDTAVRAKSANWTIWIARAELSLAEGKVKNAEHCLLKAFESGDIPKWWIHRRAGEMMFLHDQPQLALNHFRQALDLEPRVAMNYVRVAQAHKELGQIEQARKRLQEALKLDSQNSDASNLLSKLSEVGILKKLWSRLNRQGG